jgi:hypothetical protein
MSTINKMFKIRSYVFISMLFLVNCNCFSSKNVVIATNTASDSLLLKQLIEINYNKLIGKEYQILLNQFAGLDFKTYYIDEPPLKLQGLFLSFSENIYIKVYFYKLTYVKAENTKRNWDIELLKKEQIRRIVLYNNNKIINDTDKNNE